MHYYHYSSSIQICIYIWFQKHANWRHMPCRRISSCWLAYFEYMLYLVICRNGICLYMLLSTRLLHESVDEMVSLFPFCSKQFHTYLSITPFVFFFYQRLSYHYYFFPLQFYFFHKMHSQFIKRTEAIQYFVTFNLTQYMYGDQMNLCLLANINETVATKIRTHIAYVLYINSRTLI